MVVSTRDIMAQLHVTRVKREFKEIVTSEEVIRAGLFVRWAYIYPVVAPRFVGAVLRELVEILIVSPHLRP